MMIQRVVPNAHAVDWVGKLTHMGTNSNGDAYVEIEIASGITVKTWNNAFSDAADRSMISNRSTLYNSVADLKVGRTVKFSADLLRIANLTERGSFEEPDMIARFSKIEGLK